MTKVKKGDLYFVRGDNHAFAELAGPFEITEIMTTTFRLSNGVRYILSNLREYGTNDGWYGGVAIPVSERLTSEKARQDLWGSIKRYQQGVFMDLPKDRKNMQIEQLQVIENSFKEIHSIIKNHKGDAK